VELKSLLSASSLITIAYPDPDLKGFEVSLQYMSRDLLQKLRKQATTIGFNKATRLPEEAIDDDLFYKLYVGAALKGWTGLKIKYLAELMPVDLSSVTDTEAEFPFSEEAATTLVKNSTAFDNWLMAVINDVSLFNKTV
jgi:hypothetical protein